MAKQKWIQEAIKQPGAFSAKAEKKGMGTLEFARKVIANPDRYDTRTVRQARLALILSRLRKRRKKKSRS